MNNVTNYPTQTQQSSTKRDVPWYVKGLLAAVIAVDILILLTLFCIGPLVQYTGVCGGSAVVNRVQNIFLSLPKTQAVEGDYSFVVVEDRNMYTISPVQFINSALGRGVCKGQTGYVYVDSTGKAVCKTVDFGEELQFPEITYDEQAYLLNIGNTTYSLANLKDIYLAGAGLDLTGTTFSVDSPTCATNQYLAWTGTSFECRELPASVTYTASGELLNLTDTTFSVREGTLTDGSICKYSATDGLICDTSDTEVGLWSRTGTTLSPRFVGDDVVLRSGETLTIQDLNTQGAVLVTDSTGQVSQVPAIYWRDAADPMFDTLFVQGRIYGTYDYVKSTADPLVRSMAYGEYKTRIQVTSDFEQRGFATRIYTAVDPGQTHNQYVSSFWGYLTASEVAGQAHAGTISRMTGITLQQGFRETNPAITGSITNLYGALIGNFFYAGHVDNSYGIFITGQYGAGTVTNNWGVYVADANMKNMFAGDVIIGGGLDVDGTLLDSADSAGTAGALLYSTGSGVNWSTDLIWDAATHSLGIGTTSPTAALHVLQTDYTRPGFVVRATVAAPWHNLVRVEDSNGVDRFRIDQFFDVYLKNASGVDTIVLTDEGDVQVRSGRLGVGTSAPQAAVDIVNGVLVGRSGGSPASFGITTAPGPWFIWDPSKGAFRTGNITIPNLWDAGNIGNNTGILGGTDNQATVPNAAVVGGSSNVVTGSEAVILGGAGNTVTGPGSGILAAETSSVDGMTGAVVGALNGNVAGDYSVVMAGSDNVVEVSVTNSAVIGGNLNTVGDGVSVVSDSAIIGGNSNTVFGSSSVIMGGTTNSIGGVSSVVLGGSDNIVDGDFSVAGGQGMMIDLGAVGTFVWGYDPTLGGLPIADSNVFLIGPYGTTYMVGINTDAPTYALTLPNDPSNTVGKGIAFAWDIYSDQRVKTVEGVLNYGLAEVLQLEPKRYVHHPSKFKNGQLVVESGGEETFGLIAQEVYQIIPEIVNKPADENSQLWTMDYTRLIPVLINAIKDLNTKVDAIAGGAAGTTSAYWSLDSNNVLTTAYDITAPALLAQTGNVTDLTASVFKTTTLEVGGAKLSIDQNGHLVTSGSITADTITASKIVTDTLETGVLVVKDMKGEIVVPAGDLQVVVQNPNVKATDIILVTPYGDTAVSYSVKREDGKFTIVLDAPAAADITFGWLVVK